MVNRLLQFVLFIRLGFDHCGPVSFFFRRHQSQVVRWCGDFFVLPRALANVQPAHMEFFSFCRFHVQQHVAAVGKKEGVLDAGVGRAIGFVGAALAEQVVTGRASEDVYLGDEAA